MAGGNLAVYLLTMCRQHRNSRLISRSDFGIAVGLRIDWDSMTPATWWWTDAQKDHFRILTVQVVVNNNQLLGMSITGYPVESLKGQLIHFITVSL